MTKAIKVYLSDVEFETLDKLVCAGFGRTWSDFVKSAVVVYIDKLKTDLAEARP